MVNKLEFTNFKFWCQNVLPAIYDDSLSYYELLCKLVNQLNDVMQETESAFNQLVDEENNFEISINSQWSQYQSNMNDAWEDYKETTDEDLANYKNNLNSEWNNVQQTWNQLREFVNNYFNNLDVQEEINNKLDTMAQDGTLSVLIQPMFDTFKAQIESNVSSNTARIQTLEGRVNSFTRLTEGSTTGDAELIDGRVWFNGITSDNIGDAIRGQSEGAYTGKNEIQYPFTLNGYYTNDGHNNIIFSESLAFTSTILEVNEGDKIYSNNTFSLQTWTLFTDETLDTTTGRLRSNLNCVNGYTPVITIPSGFTRLVIPVRKEYISTTILSKKPITNIYDTNKLNTIKNFLSNTLKGINYNEGEFESVFNILNHCIRMSFNITGTVKSRFLVDLGVSEIECMWYDHYGTVILGYTEEFTYEYSLTNNRVTKRNLQTNEIEIITSFENLENVNKPKYMYIKNDNGFVSICLGGVINKVYTIDISEYNCINSLGYSSGIIDRTTSILTITNCSFYLNKMPVQEERKKWYAYGTSLTEDTVSNFGHYTKYVSEKLNLELHNYGLGGSGIVPSLHGSDNVKTRCMRLTDGKENADLITVEIMPNDMTAELGSVLDTGDDTFLGNLSQILQYLQQNTNAQIIVLTMNLSRRSLDGATQYTPQSEAVAKRIEWSEAISKLCLMYGVMHIDCRECGLGYYRLGSTSKYMLDNIHFSPLGAKNIAEYLIPRIKEAGTFISE